MQDNLNSTTNCHIIYLPFIDILIKYIKINDGFIYIIILFTNVDLYFKRLQHFYDNLYSFFNLIFSKILWKQNEINPKKYYIL